MIFFRIVWAIDIAVTLIFVAFFFVGVNDGSVSSFNIVLWAVILAGLAVSVFGANALARQGRTVLATLLAAVPALPAVLFGLLLVIGWATGARWNYARAWLDGGGIDHRYNSVSSWRTGKATRVSVSSAPNWRITSASPWTRKVRSGLIARCHASSSAWSACAEKPLIVWIPARTGTSSPNRRA